MFGKDLFYYTLEAKKKMHKRCCLFGCLPPSQITSIISKMLLQIS